MWKNPIWVRVLKIKTTYVNWEKVYSLPHPAYINMGL